MITVQANINAPISKVWAFWTLAEHIVHWNFASNDWHCPQAKNNLAVGGKFIYTMAAKDNSMRFEFEGTHHTIELHKSIESVLSDGRKLIVTMEAIGATTQVTEQFEPEQENPEAMQQMGWQMILNNFKEYTEGH
jgi:uncharacterized protein YndB with AHSA1/START domain